MPSEVVLCDDHVHDCPHLLKNVRRLEEENERLRAENRGHLANNENLADACKQYERRAVKAEEENERLREEAESSHPYYEKWTEAGQEIERLRERDAEWVRVVKKVGGRWEKDPYGACREILDRMSDEAQDWIKVGVHGHSVCEQTKPLQEEIERLRVEIADRDQRLHACGDLVSRLRQQKGKAITLNAGLKAKIEAALALHTPVYWDGKQRCRGCATDAEVAEDKPEWPCPTVKALQGGGR